MLMLRLKKLAEDKSKPGNVSKKLNRRGSFVEHRISDVLPFYSFYFKNEVSLIIQNHAAFKSTITGGTESDYIVSCFVQPSARPHVAH